MPTVTTPTGICSFPNLYKARPAVEGAEPRFGLAIIYGPEAQKSAQMLELKKAVKAVAIERFGEKVDLEKLRTPFRPAGEKDYAGYEDGHIFISPWSKLQPGVVDVDRNEVLAPEDVWAGQEVRAIVTPFAYDTSGNKGVALGLQHVQIIKTDGPRLDGRVSAEKAFDDGLVEPSSLENDDDIPF